MQLSEVWVSKNRFRVFTIYSEGDNFYLIYRRGSAHYDIEPGASWSFFMGCMLAREAYERHYDIFMSRKKAEEKIRKWREYALRDGFSYFSSFESEGSYLVKGCSLW
jgi:hypothetical protein